MSFLYERDPTTILLASDHAQERKELFYAKMKVSRFVNFEVGRLKFHVCHCSGVFYHF